MAIKVNLMNFIIFLFFILQLANQHSIQFFETSAWQNINVTEAFTCIAEQVLDKVGVALDCTCTNITMCTCSIEILIVVLSLTRTQEFVSNTSFIS